MVRRALENLLVAAVAALIEGLARLHEHWMEDPHARRD